MSKPYKFVKGEPFIKYNGTSYLVTRSVMRDGKTTNENIDVDKKIIEVGHHHGSTYYEHLAFLKAIESTSTSDSWSDW